MCKEYQINELIESHVHIVPIIANRYFDYRNEHVYNDLLSVGYEALVKAGHNYQGLAKFTTYAGKYVKFAMIGYFRKESRRAQKIVGSLDAPYGEDGSPWHERIEDEAASYADAVVNELLLNQAIDGLAEELREVIDLHFGLDAGEPMPLREVGERTGLKTSGVFGRKSRALKAMRKAVHVG